MSLERSERTVLIVEDEQPVRETFELHLQETPYTVKSAANGGEALVKLRGDVDVVLLDRRLPGMSGDDVLENLIQINPDCRVVIVSAIDPGENLAELGCEAYLTKPAAKAEILETVDQQILLDEYEELLLEYHEAAQTHAMLASHFDDDTDAVEDAAREREQLGNELTEILGSFTDETLKRMVTEIQSSA